MHYGLFSYFIEEECSNYIVNTYESKYAELKFMNKKCLVFIVSKHQSSIIIIIVFTQIGFEAKTLCISKIMLKDIK